jgi:hypothetical protein
MAVTAISVNDAVRQKIWIPEGFCNKGTTIANKVSTLRTIHFQQFRWFALLAGIKGGITAATAPSADIHRMARVAGDLAR